MSETLWNIKELARFLGYSERVTRELVAQGIIPKVSMGGRKLRFHPDVIDKWARDRSGAENAQEN